MFICTFYHTPVAFCDRGIVFYITKGVSLMRHPLYQSHYFSILLRKDVPVFIGGTFKYSQIEAPTSANDSRIPRFIFSLTLSSP